MVRDEGSCLDLRNGRRYDEQRVMQMQSGTWAGNYQHDWKRKRKEMKRLVWTDFDDVAADVLDELMMMLLWL